MKKYTAQQLISEGFAPSVARAKMSIPFKPNPACSEEQFQKLPANIQKMYKKQDNFMYFLSGE